METKIKYYVERFLHNGETGAEDYQKPDAFENKDMAIKKFHEYISAFVGYGKLDRVAVSIRDSFMNDIEKPYVWVKPVDPESEPEPEDDRLLSED